MFRNFAFGVALFSALPAAAQQPALPVTTGQPVMSAPSSYRSAFADYRAWVDEPPLSWRAANDAAAALGGHMGHLRGMAPVSSGTPAKTTTPAPAGSTTMPMERPR